MASEVPVAATIDPAILEVVRSGLTASPKTLPPWLFYDEAGSNLFEQITALPEYYLTRTERAILTTYADAILVAAGDTPHASSPAAGPLSFAELGAGTATKTGVLLRAAVGRQRTVLYQPIDVSPSALEEAATLEHSIPGARVRPQVANYITNPIQIARDPGARVVVLYIGSSIGNFSPEDARGVLRKLRKQLHPGDSLLLGTDMAPGEQKSVATLLAAYDDAAGVTATFNRNILVRLNRDLAANFRTECFAHRARWNAAASRIEMHLEALAAQVVHIPATEGSSALSIPFQQGETIHTENSYKFTSSSLNALLTESSFAATHTWQDTEKLFAVTLAAAS